MRTIDVPLRQRGYPIHIGAGLLSSLGRLLAESCPAPTAAIVSDDQVAPHYAKTALTAMIEAGYRTSLLVVKAGEESKTLGTASGLYSDFAEAGIERRSPIVALGGGMVGDLAGFVAATWLRGVPFVQVPTTLVADFDAAVGGKTAVNHPAGKNLIGAFHQPRMVLIDTATLATLDMRDFRAGLAESVKHGIIRDADLFAWHEDHAHDILGRDVEVLSELIERNCRIKADVVAADEREAELRAILNFGHTVGHAIESDQRYALRHGECVSIGMVAASAIAVARRMISQNDADRIARLLEEFGLPTRLDRPIDIETLMAFMQKDKKVLSGKIRFVLPTAIGHVITTSEVTDEEIAAGVRAIQPA
jgi:3-dehydroquinate synthase